MISLCSDRGVFSVWHLIGLTKSRERLVAGILEAFSENTADLDQRLTKLEEVLLQADLGW